MKGNRLEIIAQIIKQQPVATQEELLILLRERGYHVTQATVSRDIKTLRLSKIVDTDGMTRYSAPSNVPSPNQLDKFYTILRESVESVAIAGNIIVIKCATGMANAACAALDAMRFDHIIGTIAGDDTIFAAVDNADSARAIMQKLQQLL